MVNEGEGVGSRIIDQQAVVGGQQQAMVVIAPHAVDGRDRGWQRDGATQAPRPPEGGGLEAV